MQTLCGITTDGMLDYLSAIYKLGRYESRVTTSALSERMNVSAAAASSMLKRLEESNFIQRSNAGGIVLTEQGVLAALQLVRRHRLLEVFLIQVLGYTWDQVDAEAHRLEHAVSDAFVERIDTMCNFPTHCPHGDPIPRKDGSMAEEQPAMVLTALQPGQIGTLRRVSNHDGRVLRYLTRLHLTPGRPVQLLDAAPFRGPVKLKLLGDPQAESIAPEDMTPMIGCELAEYLFVSLSTA